MARKDKPVQLRTVDDSNPEPKPAVRLDNPETAWRSKEPKPVRLGPTEDPGTSQRLDLPDRDEVELRTHQPGIDVLIEPEAAPPELVEEAWGEATLRRHPIPWGWFALIGLAIAGAVLWSLSRVGKSDTQAVKVRSEAVTALVDEEREEKEAAALIDRIDATARDFVAATSVERLSRLVRQPERVTPLMRAHYGSKPVYLGRLNSIKSLQPVTLGNHGNFWVATVALSDEKSHSMIIEIGKNGEPRVDWETFVCHQPMPWDDFARERPAGTSLDFRVHVEPDNFYSHEFANSQQWVCFRLTTLNAEETLFGYARADRPVAQEIQSLIRQNGGKKTSLILQLSIPEGLQSRRGVVIEKVRSPRWIYLDAPDSAS